VHVSAWQGQVSVWHQGQRVLTVTKRTRSGTCVPHPDQFRTVLPAAAARRASAPLGHQIAAPVVAQRPLSEYDRLCGVHGRGVHGRGVHGRGGFGRLGGSGSDGAERMVDRMEEVAS
jgi:hypothetical protein